MTAASPEHLAQTHAAVQWLRQRVRGSLQSDSRLVRSGDGFVAWPGAANDARCYVALALQAGATAALIEQHGADKWGFATDPRVLAVPNLKALAGPIASAYCEHPSAQMNLIAITGTNGKTSTAWWTAQLLLACARPCAVIGTLGIGQPPLPGRAGPALVSTGLTTPDPVRLHTQLRAMQDAGIGYCAIEASSIGLVEHRLNASRIRTAVFTNFTQDHLDFHGSMQTYWAAKATLFDWPGLAAAVVNLDDPKGPALAARLHERGLDVWGLSLHNPPHRHARLSLHELQCDAHGLRAIVTERNRAGLCIESHPVSLPILGQYNAANLLCALGAARASAVPLAQAVHACSALSAVPGRMQAVAPTSPHEPLVLVDYAHTPDALEQALATLRPIARQRGGALWVVVGCGGNRDASKRATMARAAQRGSDRAVLTSDNPRHEDPMSILGHMQSGLSPSPPVHIEPQRDAAIAWAIGHAQPQDVVLIAGKGHEQYQEIGSLKIAFSDPQHAQAALHQRRPARIDHP